MKYKRETDVCSDCCSISLHAQHCPLRLDGLVLRYHCFVVSFCCFPGFPFFVHEFLFCSTWDHPFGRQSCFLICFLYLTFWLFFGLFPSGRLLHAVRGVECSHPEAMDWLHCSEQTEALECCSLSDTFMDRFFLVQW